MVWEKKGEVGLTETRVDQAGEAGKDEDVEGPGHAVGEGEDALPPVYAGGLEEEEVVARGTEGPAAALREEDGPRLRHVGQGAGAEGLAGARLRAGREHEADVVAVLAGRGADLLEDVVGGRGAVSKELDEHVVAARLLADLEQLAAARQTGDLVGDDGLVQPAQALRDGVLGRLVQAPDVPVALLEVDGHVAAHAHGAGEVALLQQLRDAVILKDGVGVHADQVRDVVDAGVVAQEQGHLGEEGRAEEHLRLLGPHVELVQERAQCDQPVALALVLVLDDAEVRRALVRPLLDRHVHGLLVPRRVRLLDHLALRLLRQDVVQQVLRRRLLHARPAHPPVADDHDGSLVLLQVLLRHQRVERLGALVKVLVVAGEQQHERLGRGREDDLFGEDAVLDAEEDAGEDHDAVESDGEGDEGEVEVVVRWPEPGRKDENEAGEWSVLVSGLTVKLDNSLR